MSYSKKQPINLIDKEIKTRLLSMTMQAFEAEERAITSKCKSLKMEIDIINKRIEDLKKEEKSLSWSEISKNRDKISASLPEINKTFFEELTRSKKKEIERRGYIYDEANKLYHLTLEDKQHSLTQKINTLIELLKGLEKSLPLLVKEWRELKRILSAAPEIKKRIQKRERAERLGGFEGKVRTQGESIAKKLRKDAADPFLCPYCEYSTYIQESHVDHINPVSNGGLSKENNMVLVCADCNLKKSNNSLMSFCESNDLNLLRVSENLRSLGKWV